VDTAYWNIDRLIFSQQLRFIVNSDIGCPGNHDPMLRSMVMHLYGQLLTWLHSDALYLVSVTIVDGVVLTPRAVNFSVQLKLAPFLPFQLGDNLLYILHAVSIGHQHSVLGLNNNQILNTHRSHQSVFSEYVSIIAVLANHISSTHITARILLTQLPKC